MLFKIYIYIILWSVWVCLGWLRVYYIKLCDHTATLSMFGHNVSHNICSLILANQFNSGPNHHCYSIGLTSYIVTHCYFWWPVVPATFLAACTTPTWTSCFLAEKPVTSTYFEFHYKLWEVVATKILPSKIFTWLYYNPCYLFCTTLCGCQCTPQHPQILFPYNDTKMASHPPHLQNL